MTLSTGPWWWAPVFALGWMTTVPAQSFSAPARAWVIAAARFMPGVWAVLMSSSFERTTRTPSNFHLGLEPAMGNLYSRIMLMKRSLAALAFALACGSALAQTDATVQADREQLRKDRPHLRPPHRLPSPAPPPANAAPDPPATHPPDPHRPRPPPPT